MAKSDQELTDQTFENGWSMSQNIKNAKNSSQHLNRLVALIISLNQNKISWNIHFAIFSSLNWNWLWGLSSMEHLLLPRIAVVKCPPWIFVCKFTKFPHSCANFAWWISLYNFTWKIDAVVITHKNRLNSIFNTHFYCSIIEWKWSQLRFNGCFWRWQKQVNICNLFKSINYHTFMVCFLSSFEVGKLNFLEHRYIKDFNHITKNWAFGSNLKEFQCANIMLFLFYAGKNWNYILIFKEAIFYKFMSYFNQLFLLVLTCENLLPYFQNR